MISNVDQRIITSMIEKIDRLLEIRKKHSLEVIQNEYVLSDAIQFEFEKLYEDSTRLSIEFRMNYKDLHIDELRGIRNRVAHNYESVSLNILLDTIDKDLPQLKTLLLNVL